MTSENIFKMADEEHKRIIMYAHKLTSEQADEYIREENRRFEEEAKEHDRISAKYGAIYGGFTSRTYPVPQTTVRKIAEDDRYFLNHVERVMYPVPEEEVLHYIAYRYSVTDVDMSVLDIDGDFIRIGTTYRDPDDGHREYDTPFYAKVKDGVIEYIIVHPSSDFCEMLGVRF